MAREATVEDLLTKKKPTTKTVRITLDNELAQQWHAAKGKVDAAKLAYARIASSDNEEQLRDAEAALEECEKLVEPATVEITLRSIGRPAYRALLDEHPPTDEQNKDSKRKGFGELNYNPDTFPQALVAACSLSPKMTLAEVQAIYSSNDYNDEELNTLTLAALTVNQTSEVVALGKGSGKTAG